MQSFDDFVEIVRCLRAEEKFQETAISKCEGRTASMVNPTLCQMRTACKLYLA